MTRLPVIPAAALAAMMILASCSDTAVKPAAAPEAAKEPAKPAEPGPAKPAFWKMYKPIREWSKDVQLLSMNNKTIPEMKGAEGKEAAWDAIFVSASKHQSRKVTYSEVDSGSDLRKGVTIFGESAWGGPTRDLEPFANSEFGTDSDAAYKTAAAKAADWLKAHPNQPLTILLGKAAAYATPVWAFTWGDKKSGFIAVVNATTGDLISPK